MRPNTLVIGYYRDKVSVDQLMDSVADKAHKVGPGFWHRQVICWPDGR